MRWLKQPEPRRTRNKSATKIDMQALSRDVFNYPDAYQYERAKRLGVSEKGIGHALRRMGINFCPQYAAHARLCTGWGDVTAHKIDTPKGERMPLVL